MKKLRYILGVSLLMPSFVFAPVMAYAHSDDDANNSTLAATNDNETKDSSKDTDEDANDDSRIKPPSTDPALRKKRLDGLKVSLKIVLDEKTRKVLVQKCKPAQTIVGTAEKADTAIGTKRGQAYDKIVSNLKALIDKLKGAGVDTAALSTAVATLEQKIATFDTDMGTYQQSLSDLRTLDCATDPAAFKAALTAALTDREKVRTDALDIRAFIKNTIKPALQDIKAKIKAEKDNSGGNQ